MSEKQPKQKQKHAFMVYLYGKDVDTWMYLVSRPGYNDQQEVFREMMRTYCNHNGINMDDPPKDIDLGEELID